MGKAQTEAAAVARVRRRRLEMVMAVDGVGINEMIAKGCCHGRMTNR
jgi:hypothetical protein